MGKSNTITVFASVGFCCMGLNAWSKQTNEYMQFFICKIDDSDECVSYLQWKQNNKPTLFIDLIANFWPVLRDECMWALSAKKQSFCHYRAYVFALSRRIRFACVCDTFHTITSTTQFFFSTSAIIAHKTTRSKNLLFLARKPIEQNKKLLSTIKLCPHSFQLLQIYLNNVLFVWSQVNFANK